MNASTVCHSGQAWTEQREHLQNDVVEQILHAVAVALHADLQDDVIVEYLVTAVVAVVDDAHEVVVAKTFAYETESLLCVKE